MADSKYPDQLDTDVEIPRINNNVTEVGGESINGLRSSVFQIEQTLGINPQGTANDVATRLSQSLNPDGTIKNSAIASVGLVTLPITNSMVGSNAGIDELKLDLDYPTKTLRELIGALRTEHDALVLSVQNDITNLSNHTAHPATFGRHYTSDIDGYTGEYASFNLQGIIDSLNTKITNHIIDPIDAHDASAIYFDDTDTFINGDDVQTAIEEIDALGKTTLILHQDKQHSNGILRTQKTYYSGNKSNVIVSSSAINSFSSGAKNVSFVSSPTGLNEIVRGDRIEITSGGETYIRFVDKVNTDTNFVYFFDALPSSGTSATATIYRSTEETSAPSVLGLCIRSDTIGGNFGGSVIQLVHPNAPYILSDGLNPRLITENNNNIQLSWENGTTSIIDAYQALQDYPISNSTPSTWTPENLVIALNEEFKKDGNNYPFTAFVYKGEIGIAYDEPDGYLKLETPTDSAWSAFGLVGTEIVYSLGPRRFYVDGYEFNGIRKIVDATANTDGSSIIKGISQDLVALGIEQSGIVRLKNHADAGTYTFNTITSNTMTVSSHISGFSVDSSVNIEIYGDSFSVPTTPTFHTLYELFIDGYNNTHGQLRGAPRVEYTFGGNSADSPETWFNIVDISRDFQAGSKRIKFEESSGTRTIQMGTPVTSPSTSVNITNGGIVATLPSSNVKGYEFRLYDYNGVDYVDLVIANDSFLTVTNDNAIDLTIYPRISEQRYIQIGQVLHDTLRFKNLSDRRIVGTVGRKDIRNDYTRDYISYPRSLMRGNGVIHGLSTSATGDVSGGTAVVNGELFSVERTEFSVPTDGVSTTYNVFVDENGALRFWRDNLDAGASLISPSLNEIVASRNKTIISQIDVNASGTITAVRDLRRFVNNIDNKLELIVEENDITHGSFASLDAAFNYINAWGTSSATPYVIKIRGEVEYDLSNGSISVPAGVTIRGESSGLYDAGGGGKITLTGSGFAFLVPSGSLNIENLHIELDSSASVFNLIGDNTTAIDGLRINNCRFVNLQNSSSTIYALGPSSLTNSAIINTYVDLNSTNGDASFIQCTGGIIDLFLDNIEANFSGTTNNQYFVAALGGATRLACKNTQINFNSSATSYITDFSSATSNVIFDCIYATNLTNGVSISAAATNIMLSNSYISECSNSLITITASNSSYIHIENNTLLTSNVTTTNGLLKLSNISNLQIYGNIIKYLSSGTNTVSSASKMISIYDCSEYTITNNHLINKDSISQGIRSAIFIDGSTVINGNISNNTFKYFKYLSGASTGYAVCFSDGAAENVIISNNHIIECRSCIHLFTLTDVIIDGNYINTTTGDNGLYGRGIHFENCSNINIVNNTIISEETVLGSNSFLASGTVSTSINDHIVVSGNNFVASNTSDSSTSLIFMLINNGAFIGNSVSGGNFTTSPITVMAIASGEGNIVTGNVFDLTCNSGSNSVLSIGDYDTEYLNKGQLYSKILPLSGAVIESGTNWSFAFTPGVYAGVYLSNTGTANEDVGINFSTMNVPVGATLTSIDVVCHATGAASDFEIAIYRQYWEAIGSGTQAISSGTNPSTTAPETVSVAISSNNIMTDDFRYFVYMTTNSGISGAVSIYTVRLNYTL